MSLYEWNKELCQDYADKMRSLVKFDHRPWAKRINACIKNRKPDMSFIDIATGPGFLLLELGKLNESPDLFAHDSSANMLEIAKSEAELVDLHINTISSTAENIEAISDSKDVVTCKQLIHEADDIDRVISEIYRITKPGGQAFLIDFDKGKGKFWVFMTRLFMFFMKGGQISKNFYKSYKNAEAGIRMREKFEKAGFKNVVYKTYKYNYFIYGEKEEIKEETTNE